MKKSIYLVALALIMATTTMAKQQEQTKQRELPTAEQMAKMKAERMRKQLLLGNEQYEKVYKSCLKQAEKQHKRMMQAAKEQEEFSAEMKGVLNEAQLKRYEQTHKPRMRKGVQQGRRLHPRHRMHCPMMTYRHRAMQSTDAKQHNR